MFNDELSIEAVACIMTISSSTRSPTYPSSAVIKSVSFAPSSQIMKKAEGSDNWPITWGSDDVLFTAYGDGWGFEPPVDKKLSLGLAEVMGLPPDFHGVNIRSPSGEHLGDGIKGPKASGLLAVDDVLYMWIRNVDNSRLAWSADNGRTWIYGFFFRKSFGCPTFLNFGRNYGGSRDDFVYIYSQDGASAYVSYDGIVLARVPRNMIREREEYEFYKGRDGGGEPLWGHSIEERVPIFVFHGNCQRLDVVYNAGIKRYLLALGFDHRGGWGLFDAPEPWGPWTTAFFTERWDCSDTHGYRLPSKWISEDGTTMYLVFSGMGEYDAFCVRKMSLRLKGEGTP